MINNKKRKPLTEEHKNKIRESMRITKESGVAIGHPKGTPTWNKGMSLANGDKLTYGRPMSKETKKRLYDLMKGVPKSEETKRKISLSLTGRKLSDEHRINSGLGHRGIKRTFSAEHRLKISIANKGRVLTKEWIRKSLARSPMSSLEVKFQNIANKLQLPYRFVGNGEVIIGRKNPDFVNTNGEKIAVEVYAKYYKRRHCEDIEQWKDDRRKAFNVYGWDVLFLDETQVNEPEVIKLLGGK